MQLLTDAMPRIEKMTLKLDDEAEDLADILAALPSHLRVLQLWLDPLGAGCGPETIAALPPDLDGLCVLTALPPGGAIGGAPIFPFASLRSLVIADVCMHVVLWLRVRV